MCQQYLLFAEGQLLYIYRAVIACVYVCGYIHERCSAGLMNTSRWQIYIAQQQSGSDTPKINFRPLTRPGPGIPQSKMSQGLPFHTSLLLLSPSSSLFCPQLSHGHSTNCSSSLSICQPCYLVPQCTALGESWVGKSSSPGQVRRELITFQCYFSMLCKEQSVLITVDYRRILI